MKKLFLFLAAIAAGFAQPVTQIGTGNVSNALYFGGATTGGNVTGSSGALTFTALGTNQGFGFTPSGTGNMALGFSPDTTGGMINIKARSATTTPIFANWNSTNDGISIYGEATGGVNISTAGAAGVRGNLQFRKANGTLASPTVVVNNDQISTMSGSGYDGTGQNGGAFIGYYVDGTVSTGVVPGEIRFGAANPAGTIAQFWRMRSTGILMVRQQPSTAAAWGVNGISFQAGAQTVTDSSSGTGTVASAVFNSFLGATINANSTSVVYTDLANAYFQAPNTTGNASATNKWCIWGTGQMRMDGPTTIGGNTGVAGGGINDTIALTIGSPTVASGTNAYGAFGASTVPSSITTGFVQFYSNPRTAAASFTAGYLSNFAAVGTSIGSGSAVTNLIGFEVQPTMTQGTNNWAFRGTLATSGTARWNLYMDGTAPNFIAGTLRMGTTTGTSLVDSSGAFTLTGGTGNMTVVAGSGNSRTYTLQTTTSGGTATNAEIISATQQFRWPAYGAGALTTDGSGNITAASDARLKDIQGDYTEGLAEILKVHPKIFRWNKASGFDRNDLNAGLIAQDLLTAGLKHAVIGERSVDVMEEVPGSSGLLRRQKRDAQGELIKQRVPQEFYTVSDRALIAALINSVQQLNAMNEQLSAETAENASAAKKFALAAAITGAAGGAGVAGAMGRRKSKQTTPTA